LWFSLIGFSTVLTYQHHVIDVAAGFVLAGYCFYLFREAPVAEPAAGNFRIAVYYTFGVVASICLAALFWPWGSLLLWVTYALNTVARAHFWRGPGIFRKTDGRLPLSAKFVLAPFLFGQELSLLYYKRQCRPWDEVVPGVLIGRKLNDPEADEAIRSGVTAVLDLTSEFSEAKPFLRMRYLNIPILDLSAPSQEELRQMAEFITKNVDAGKVYVHCKVGYSRSAAAVGAYLISGGKAASAEEAIIILRRARPTIVVRPEIIEALKMFAGRDGAMAEIPANSSLPTV
jgi:predicted protein tyrosine phosphatase